MAQLRIYGDIVSKDEKTFLEFFGDTDSVSFKDVDEFISSIPDDDQKIDLYLNCRGGDVSTGWMIYDSLRATGKEISATVDGLCASMATIILLAAPKESRAARPHASLLIHNPYIPYAEGELNADELQSLAEKMKVEQNKILDLYAERTGADRERLAEYMDAAKEMTAEEAKELGFISKIISPASAKASGQIKNQKMSLLEKLKALITSEEVDEVVEETAPVVALELNTESGGTLTVEREEGEPQVGDKATPDGTHKMPDGKTIVVEDGVITEIETEDPEEEAEESEVETLKKENEELRKQLEEANAKADELTAQARTKEDLRILNAVKVAGGIDKVLAKIKSEGKVEGRIVDGSNAAAKADERSCIRKELDEILAKKHNKK